jgi:hypothetical protein
MATSRAEDTLGDRLGARADYGLILAMNAVVDSVPIMGAGIEVVLRGRGAAIDVIEPDGPDSLAVAGATRPGGDASEAKHLAGNESLVCPEPIIADCSPGAVVEDLNTTRTGRTASQSNAVWIYAAARTVVAASAR